MPSLPEDPDQDTGDLPDGIDEDILDTDEVDTAQIAHPTPNTTPAPLG